MVVNMVVYMVINMVVYMVVNMVVNMVVYMILHMVLYMGVYMVVNMVVHIVVHMDIYNGRILAEIYCIFGIRLKSKVIRYFSLSDVGLCSILLIMFSGRPKFKW